MRNQKNVVYHGLLLLLLSTFVPVYAQPLITDPDQVKSNPAYYWGEYTGVTAREASDKALAYLIQQIAVKVTSDFSHLTEERNRQVTETSTGLVNSYAAATLRNVHTIRKPAKNGFYVFQYISREEVEKIFKERGDLVYDIFLKAEQFEAARNVGYALQWYYNALLLAHSIPRASISAGGFNLTSEIPVRINRVLANVSFELVDQVELAAQEREITLAVKLDGEPVSRLSFSFWDGMDEVQVHAADGLATVRLYGASVSMEELRCNVQYQFYSQREEIRELAEVWDFVKKPSFGESKVVSLRRKATAPAKKSVASLKKTPVNSGAIETTSLPEFFKKAAPLAETAIRTLLWSPDSTRSPSEDREFLMKWAAIKQFNSIKPSQKQPVWNAEPTWDAAEVREVAVLNRYETIGLQSREYLIPDFDASGRLIDMNYGVMEGLYETVKGQAVHTGDWKERQVLVKFLEKYRTAFMTRDLETLNMIFADEAVIIVGRKLRVGESAAQYNYVPEGDVQPGVAYLKQTKSEYLSRQKRLFGDRKDIYLGYSTFQILRKNNQPGIYGISMRQNYQSDGYADEGYLFLLVDFNGKQPQIYVRAWQPGEWREDALIGLGSFQVYK